MEFISFSRHLKTDFFFALELINVIIYDNSNMSIFDCLKNIRMILSV